MRCYYQNFCYCKSSDQFIDRQNWFWMEYFGWVESNKSWIAHITITKEYIITFFQSPPHIHGKMCRYWKGLIFVYTLKNHLKRNFKCFLSSFGQTSSKVWFSSKVVNALSSGKFYFDIWGFPSTTRQDTTLTDLHWFVNYNIVLSSNAIILFSIIFLRGSFTKRLVLFKDL